MPESVPAPRPQDFGIGRLFWNIREAVIVGDAASGRIVIWNPGAEKMFGYSAAEAVGQSIELIVPEHLRERHRAGLARFNATGHGDLVDSPGALELPARHQSGAERTIELSLYPIEDASAVGRFVLAIVRDVTERRRLENERLELGRAQAAREEAEAIQRRLAFLAEASKQLASSLDYDITLARVARLAVPDLADWCIVDLLDQDGQVRRVEVAHADPARAEQAARLKDFPPDLRSPAGIPQVMRAGQAELIAELTDERLAAVARDETHARLVREAGMRSLMRVPLVARGRTLGTITFVAAESGRRYGPADLVLAEELAARCGLAVDNARLFADAERSVRARDEFLALASHDLKTPLTAIKVNAQLVQNRARRQDGPDAEWIIERLKKIDSTAGRMSRLIDELLDVAQLQIGEPLTLSLGPTDLVALARQAAAEQQASGHDLRIATSAAMLIGDWDAARLERVLGNLIGNAVKYSPAASTIRVELTREQDSRGDWAVLVVSDQGIGIPADDLPHIFERFRRGANVGRRTAGTGIGLVGVRQIVEQHGGTISVESREGRGSIFTVRLPLAVPFSSGLGKSGGVPEGLK